MTNKVICRICALERNGCVNIFGPEGKLLDIQTKIDRYLNFEVKESDVLTKMVCVECCGKLNQCSEFIEMANKAQILLKIHCSEDSHDGSKSGKESTEITKSKVKQEDQRIKKENDDDEIDFDNLIAVDEWKDNQAEGLQKRRTETRGVDNTKKKTEYNKHRMKPTSLNESKKSEGKMPNKREKREENRTEERRTVRYKVEDRINQKRRENSDKIEKGDSSKKFKSDRNEKEIKYPKLRYTDDGKITNTGNKDYKQMIKISKRKPFVLAVGTGKGLIEMDGEVKSVSALDRFSEKPCLPDPDYFECHECLKKCITYEIYRQHFMKEHYDLNRSYDFRCKRCIIRISFFKDFAFHQCSTSNLSDKCLRNIGSKKHNPVNSSEKQHIKSPRADPPLMKKRSSHRSYSEERKFQPFHSSQRRDARTSKDSKKFSFLNHPNLKTFQDSQSTWLGNINKDLNISQQSYPDSSFCNISPWLDTIKNSANLLQPLLESSNAWPDHSALTSCLIGPPSNQYSTDEFPNYGGRSNYNGRGNQNPRGRGSNIQYPNSNLFSRRY